MGEVMKVKIVLKGLVVLMIGICTVSLNAMDREPAGNNLANLAYFSSTNDEIYTHTPLPIEPGKTYTLQYDYGLIQGVDIIVNGEYVVSDTKQPPKGCETSATSNNNTCTFESGQANEVEIHLKGDQLGRYFGMDNVFMLVEGSEERPYEPFIAEVDETVPEISGEGSYYVSYDAPINPESLIGSHITASDEVDGDLTNDITVLSDTYSPNQGQLGDYLVVYEVSDTSGNTAHFELTVKVIDQIPPVINGPAQIALKHDDQKAINDIIETNFSFEDDYDGVINEFKIISDSYSDNKQTLGSYTVEFEVEDSSKNVMNHTVTIEVIDDTPPVIDGPSEIEMVLSDPYDDINALLDYYVISDDYTASNDIEFKISNNATNGDLTQKGQYDITFEASDCSGNRADKTIVFTISDDIKPDIVLPSQYLTISYSDQFDLADFKSSIIVNDNSDTLNIDDIYIDTNEYSLRDFNDIGTYMISFKIDDESGNTGEARLIIETIDDVAPVFMVDNEIMVQSGLVLQENTIFDHLLKNEDIKAFEPIGIVVLDNAYEGNESTAGTYEYTVELSNEKGETMPVTSLITVREIEDDDSFINNNWWVFIPIPIIGVIGVIIRKRR